MLGVLAKAVSAKKEVCVCFFFLNSVFPPWSNEEKWDLDFDTKDKEGEQRESRVWHLEGHS